MNKITTIQQFSKEEINKTKVIVDNNMVDANKEIEDLYQQTYNDVMAFYKSEYIPYKVANKIITDEKMSQLDALRLVHTAMFKCSDISGIIAIKYIPEADNILSNAKSLYENKKIEIANDPLFVRLTGSNAERNRIIDYIMVASNMKSNIEKIENHYRHIKSLAQFINNQQDYLNRLDSMIRLKNKIIDSGFVAEMSRVTTIGI